MEQHGAHERLRQEMHKSDPEMVKLKRGAGINRPLQLIDVLSEHGHPLGLVQANL